MTARIIAKKEGAAGWLIFNNPERRNAVSVDMWEAIPGVLAGYEKDPEVDRKSTRLNSSHRL